MAARSPTNLDTSINLLDIPFVLNKMTFEEGYSTLFTAEIDAYVARPVSEGSLDLSLNDFLQQPCVVTLLQEDQTRVWHGMVTQFVQKDTTRIVYQGSNFQVTHFQISLKPHLFVTTLRTNCRIFQNMSATDIIEEILGEHEILYTWEAASGTAERIYCVQYNETDFHFISRLMEEEGLFYFFTYAEDGHTLVVYDLNCNFADNAVTSIVYDPTQAYAGWCAHRIQESNSARIAAHKTTDYNYLNPQTSLLAGGDAPNLQTNYSYPGRYRAPAEGEEFTDLWQGSEDALVQKITIHTNVPLIYMGGAFSVEGATRSTIQDVGLVPKGIRHILRYEDDLLEMQSTALQRARYENIIEAMDLTVPFVPLRVHHKRRISGVQTAVVTGADGEEIWTDEYGRVHVKFHWDLDETEYDDTTCWVRVAQSWAGATWGAVFIPRIGHEVVVSFENGDPDRPLITGCVYNEAMRPPFLPDNPTRSGFRTASSLDGDAEGQKFNEFSMDDLAGEEQVFLHAQKNFDVVVHRGCRTELIEAAGDDEGHKALEMNKGTRSALLHEGDDTLTMTKGDRQATLSEGDDSLTLEKGNWLITLNEGNNEITLSQGDMVVSITGNQSTEISQNYTLDVTGDVAINVTGATSIESQGAISIKSMQDVTIEGMNVTLKGQMNVSQEAGMEFAIAGLMVKMEAQTTCDIAGMMCNIEGTVMAEFKALMTTVKADAILQLEGGAMLKGAGGIIMLG